jgi:two-component sensor histidine kinase
MPSKENAVSESGHDAPSTGVEGFSTESLARFARVARRGLRARAAMIAGAAIEPVLMSLPPDAGGRDADLRSLCAVVEAHGSTAAVEWGAGLGIALHHPDGPVVGALCALGEPGRVWSEDDSALLADLAALFQAEANSGAELQRRRAAEEANELITRELAHRIKNIFAVIGSLVALSARGHPEAQGFAQLLIDRIAALGRANDFVRPHIGGSSQPSEQSLLGLIEALMAPYQEADRRRICVDGQDAAVGRSSMTTLALVLHELATNAVKYGALSSPAGKVVINSIASATTLTLIWQEQGGPEIETPPMQEGFGTLLSQRAAATQLGAAIRPDWRREGLVFTLEIPLQRLAY